MRSSAIARRPPSWVVTAPSIGCAGPASTAALALPPLLGTSENGRWRIYPADPAPRDCRAYRDGTMVLETVFETADGCVALIDFMPIGGANSSVVRLVEGRRGKVAMRVHLTLRF